MSKDKFTPGPWSFEQGSSEETKDTFFVCHPNTGCELTVVCAVMEFDSTKDTNEANARLISAVHDLLEALEYQKGCMESSDYSLQTFLHMRDAAIAKARGNEL